MIPQSAPPKTGTGAIRFLFIASDWQGAMQWPGGIAEYGDSILRGLMGLGDSIRVLAVVQPGEMVRLGFLARHEPWVIPFPMRCDPKPTNWLGRKCVSLLEILRCLSPNCRRVLERTAFFKGSAAAIARLEGVLSKENPTAVVFVHLNVKLYPLVLSLLEGRRPYGIIAHDSEVCRLPSNNKNDLIIRRMMLQGASWVVANSRHTKSLLEKWELRAGSVAVIHCPISDEAWQESAVFEPPSRKDNELKLVTLCRLVKGKGVDLVLRALKLLAARDIPYRYVIGGEGPERKFLEALANELGLRDKVYFQGPVGGEEKWRLLRSSDVYVMASRRDATIPWQEGFGIAFVEAAAFGLPAVGSKSGGIPDAVVEGETGILVPEDSPEELAEALTFLYRNPAARRQMGGAARERARSQFSPAVIAAHFREQILKLDRP